MADEGWSRTGRKPGDEAGPGRGGSCPVAEPVFPSQTHLPGFVEQAGALKAKGAQVVACLSVNDVFVTEEWGRAHSTQGKVRRGSPRG